VVQQNAAGSEELSSQADELSGKVGIMLEIVEGEKSTRADVRMIGQGMKTVNSKKKKMTQITGKAGGRREVRPDQAIPFGEDEAFKDF
jgi:hypothetical protein